MKMQDGIGLETLRRCNNEFLLESLLIIVKSPIFANLPASSFVASPSLSDSTLPSRITSSPEVSSDETPPQQYRSLTNIYASCQFALIVSNMEDGRLTRRKKSNWFECIFKTKFGVDGSIQRHKVQLVVKGYA